MTEERRTGSKWGVLICVKVLFKHLSGETKKKQSHDRLAGH